MNKTIKPLFLLDIHHSGYLGFGIWYGAEVPGNWTAETVERLERHPYYRMGLNLGAQTYEWSPGFAERIREWLRRYHGRFFITGGDYAQPSACIHTGESNLRQLLYGLEIIREKLGEDVTIWTVSEPGNFAQLPQVLNNLGYTGALMKIHGPGQFGSLTPRIDAGVIWWEGPDGSRIKAVPEYQDDRLFPTDYVPLSMWMMTRYRNERAERGRFTLDDFWRWKEKQAARGIDPVLMSKDDDHNDQPANNNLCMQCGHRLASDTGNDPRFRWVSAAELFAELPVPEKTMVADPNLFETRGIFAEYGYKGNTHLKADLSAEAALRLTDFVVSLAGEDRPDWEESLHAAWRTHLMAQNHDLALRHTLNVSHHLQYDSMRQADAVLKAALAGWLAKIDAASDHGAVVVFNPLGWDRDDYVQVELSESAAQGVQPYLGDEPVAWDVVQRTPGRVVMGFVAHVPSLGYQVYRLGPVRATKTPAALGASIQTESYTVQFNHEQGGLAGLWTRTGTPVIAGRSLDMSGVINGMPVRSTGRIEGVHSGARSVVVTESGEFGDFIRYQTQYRLVPGLPYIRISISMQSHFRDGQPGSPAKIEESDCGSAGLTLSLSGPAEKAVCTRFQSFLTWPYDVGINPVFGAPFWADMSQNEAGVAWLNKGDMGYRHCREDHRLDNILAVGVVNDQRWEIAVLPHDGDWQEGDVHRWGVNFGNPLHACYVPAQSGSLPPRDQLCAIEPATVTVSSAFRSGGRNYVRVYDHAGQPAELRFTRGGQPLEVEPVTLRLQPGGSTRIGANRIATVVLSK